MRPIEAERLQYAKDWNWEKHDTDHRHTATRPAVVSLPRFPDEGNPPMAYQRVIDRWLQSIEPWLVGATGPDGEQLSLPGLPEPPENRLARALPFQLAYYADQNGCSIRPTYQRLAMLNRCSLPTVKRAMRLLESSGVILRNGPAHKGKAQEWVIGFPFAKGVTGDPLTDTKGGHGTHQRGSRVTPHQSPTGIGPASARRKGRDAAADNPPELPRCAPDDDGSGITCQRCNLPLAHPRHRRAS